MIKIRTGWRHFTVTCSNFGLYPLELGKTPGDLLKNKLALRLNTGWHQVQKVYSKKLTSNTMPYQLLSYDVLENLPKENGTFESVFDVEGIMKNSFRIEPYILFPAGIRKIGYMRQRSNHPIKMVGEAHFTDPHLFDENFQ